ncbi:molybdopterin molybdotransferase MoeA [Aetokthonos hydrillicola Thurmond2011]|jgi:molybdopterin molybdotransferase|uniref:Molybdopterin molybdenumtransferase n=2 Tax=Aetokthonos TaxID=1550243 RepID=A0AAP5IEC2_9CYAN|nr:gephyrin-like molybdotransferase Glp [Aetokthonos hydrillicola]MBO3462049.1 molybdopterin molybdotransferase MoeA [Aetokthonos hydrillicola CCALA 1050]MBW4589344.1 molybdopterin molybdotransferase MoeA [Aetokthonos hydrillicola CCALA 1050]MDR9898123.1 molybdopterin molybdotransferase MoeA [Aetokthonos hydrillicola Thurmond2011]
MLSVSEAEAIILNLVQPLDKERDIEVVDLLTASHRILASPITSQLDFPHWDNSAMDGYAVRYEDVQDASESQPVSLQIVEEIPAGYQPKYTIQQGQAARILTGSVMPPGADTVVMQEATRREENRVLILATPKPQEFVRHRASYYQAGTELLSKGIILNAPDISVLAAAQCTKLPVFRKPVVAILSTGNELVTPDKALQPGQIVDSNQYALAELVRESGAEPLMLGIIKDEPDALEEAIAHAITNADIVLSSGGVSVGDYDYVEQVIESLGGEIHIRAVAMRPGKPLTVATFRLSHGRVYFGLPGNPASALVTFWRFVQPAIKKLSGLAKGWKPKFVKARSRNEIRTDGKRETYLWGETFLNSEGFYEFQLATGGHSSANLINLAQTNSLAVLPVGQTLIPAGGEVEILKQ